jgi:hypothetical protein
VGGDGAVSYRVRPPPQTNRPWPLSVKLQHQLRLPQQRCPKSATENPDFLGKAIIEPPLRERKVRLCLSSGIFLRSTIECCDVLQLGHYFVVYGQSGIP